MGKVSHETHVHFHYHKEIVDNWKQQTDVFKESCDIIGSYYGYSGMNVFYMFLYAYWSHYFSEEEYVAYIRKYIWAA